MKEFAVGVILVLVVLFAIGFGINSGLNWMNDFGRYQSLKNAENVVQINEIRIRQQEQNIQVEKQKAQIRIVEAQGIAEAQKIINATLTDKYLQHEAIEAQKSLADSPNHTTIYIPSGQNGIPLVQTVNP
jgi:hypothetical protein